MKNFYCIVLSIFLAFSVAKAQGNLPYDFLGIEHGGTIYRGGETLTLCTDGSDFSFNAEYLPIGLATADYDVISSPFNSDYPTTADLLSGAGSIATDDDFSPVIDLPFEFCFFGNNFNQIIIGDNGRVSFDITNAGGFDAWNLDPADLLPTANIDGNSIMGVYQDNHINNGSATTVTDINYGFFGDAPFRAFIINYKELPLFSCGTPLQNFQIVLHEGTNVVEVNIFNRDACTTWNDGLGVVGIMNENSTVAYVPPGRNMGDWTATNETWRFIPTSGGFDSATSLRWEVNGTYVTDDTTLETPLTADSTVELFVDYFLDCTNQTVTGSILIDIDLITLNLAQENDIILCDDPSTTLNAVEVYSTYAWYKDDVLISGETGQTLDVSDSGTYRVEYDAGTCIASDEVTVTIGGDLGLSDFTTSLCENEMLGVDLTSYYDMMRTDEPTETTSIYLTENDANNETGAITTATSYDLSVGANVFYVLLKDNNSGCTQVKMLTINVEANPVLSAYSLDMCDDGTNQFNLADYQSQHSSATLNYSYYTSMADAQAANNAMSSAMVAAFTATSGANVIYVRAESTSNCFAVTTLTININDNPVISNILVDNDMITITATGGTAPLEYSVNGTTYQPSNIFTNLSDGTFTAYVRSADGCIGTMMFTIIPQEIDFVPNTITPNGDGVNDTWVIDNIKHFPGSTVKIYDRYGKLIIDKVMDGSTDEVWDGIYLEDPLPSTTYWYFIDLSDGQKIEGYLLIKNRYKK